MGLSVWQILIVAVVILVFFGRGRISEMMGDFGKGIKSFKQGMDDDEPGKGARTPQARIEGPAHEAKPADQAAADPQAAPRSDNQG